jgi:hypothetical protein
MEDHSTELWVTYRPDAVRWQAPSTRRNDPIGYAYLLLQQQLLLFLLIILLDSDLKIRIERRITYFAAIGIVDTVAFITDA